MQEILDEFQDCFNLNNIRRFIRKSCIAYALSVVPKPMSKSESGDTVSEKGIGYQKCIQDILRKIEEDALPTS